MVIKCYEFGQPHHSDIESLLHIDACGPFASTENIRVQFATVTYRKMHYGTCNKELRRLGDPKEEDAEGTQTEFFMEERHYLCPSCLIRMIKPGRIR